jgi:hypothetical protein
MKLLIILYLGTLERIMKGLGTSKDKKGDQCAPNSSPMPQTDSDFSDPHMPGKIKT